MFSSFFGLHNTQRNRYLNRYYLFYSVFEYLSRVWPLLAKPSQSKRPDTYSTYVQLLRVTRFRCMNVVFLKFISLFLSSGIVWPSNNTNDIIRSLMLICRSICVCFFIRFGNSKNFNLTKMNEWIYILSPAEALTFQYDQPMYRIILLLLRLLMMLFLFVCECECVC